MPDPIILAITASCRTFFILRLGWNWVALFSGADRGDRLQRHTPAPVTRYWRSWSSASTAAELMCPACSREYSDKAEYNSNMQNHTLCSNYSQYLPAIYPGSRSLPLACPE